MANNIIAILKKDVIIIKETFDKISFDMIKDIYKEHDIDIIEEKEPGGQGKVYRASFRGNEVALKIFYPGSAKFRVEREVEALKKINVSQIVKFYDFNKIKINDKNCFYTISQFIEGDNLRERLIHDKLLDVDKTKKLIIDISIAIDVLWENNIVHCDIKPENIIFQEQENKFVLIDLGIAKYLDKETKTKYGRILGTPGYMSPEQLKNRSSLTLSSDMFSLGIVAFELLTGYHPFDRNQDKIIEGKPNALHYYLSEVDENLEKIINNLMDPKSYKRPHNLKEIKEILN